MRYLITALFAALTVLLAGCGANASFTQPGVSQGRLAENSSGRDRYSFTYNEAFLVPATDEAGNALERINTLSVLGSFKQTADLVDPQSSDDPAYGIAIRINGYDQSRSGGRGVTPLFIGDSGWELLPMVVGEKPPTRVVEKVVRVGPKKAELVRFTANGYTLESYAFARSDSWVEIQAWAKDSAWPRYRDQLRLAVQGFKVW